MQNPTNTKVYYSLAGVIVLLALAAGFVWLRPKPFFGTVLQSTTPAYDFALAAAEGKTVRLSDYKGKVVLLYFGYTFCPDVCPATLANASQAIRALGKKGEQVQLIMISVDPARDTPEKLAQYVTHFHPSYIGITGTDEQVSETAALYGIYFQKNEGTEATGYLIDHTATLMAVDQEGYLKLLIPFGATVEEITSDLKNLLR
ncbi:MAG: SCO family protein [Chloroflexota bacterium]